jgi:branched-subunit amino acid transport protein
MDRPDPWLVLGLAMAATFVWRAAGTMIASRINPAGALFQWFSCLSYAMLAGLITRVIVLPVGMLAETPVMDRMIAMGVGFTVFALFQRHVFAATVTAFAVFLALTGYRLDAIGT